jgi:hypothetical protein
MVILQFIVVSFINYLFQMRSIFYHIAHQYKNSRFFKIKKFNKNISLNDQSIILELILTMSNLTNDLFDQSNDEFFIGQMKQLFLDNLAICN